MTTARSGILQTFYSIMNYKQRMMLRFPKNNFSLREKRIAFEEEQETEEQKSEKQSEDEKKSNFKKVQESRDQWRTEAETAKKEAEDFKRKLEEIEKSKLAESGKFQELYEQEKNKNLDLDTRLKTFESQFTQIENANATIVENALSEFSEEDRSLAEELLSGKSSVEKVALLPKLQKRFVSEQKTDKKPIGAGKPLSNSNVSMENAELKTKRDELSELRLKVSEGKATIQEKAKMHKLTSEMQTATQDDRAKRIEEALGTASPNMNDRIL